MLYRERPRCRKIVEELLAERGCTLEALIKDNPHRLSENIRIQIKKMIQEAAAPAT